ncbi:TetR/AcrR family transcriptional regulator [Dyella sp. C11]|uniref:TetR/AcrR family transcriptional regulator n=1 Tax=Dyella sp. C11 TaxID=2126991 RepID=UPI0013002B16|nr:TetR/AcrR family transcriptional regulator [Dyella sp. C11]
MTDAPSKTPATRRVPAQARARKTRELILEAAIQLLEKRGLRGFSTNRLAEASGFSVGTIYQYFGNKQDVLDALARHERDRRLARSTKTLTARAKESGAAGLSLRERARIVVQNELRAFDGRQRARKILFDLQWRSKQHRDMDRPLKIFADMLVAGQVADGEQADVHLGAIDAFVLTQAVAGVVRAALERDEHMLLLPEFEDSLVELIVNFLESRRRKA